MGIQISDLIAEFGALNKQKEKEIFSDILANANVEEYMTPKAGIKGEYQLSRSVISELTQPFQKAFTPKGEITFKPNSIMMRRAKVDMTFDPDDIFNSWLAFLQAEKKSRTEWPITKYIIQEVIKKAKEERGKIAMSGVYAPPVAGTAGSYLAVADGVLKLITDAAASGNSNQIVTGSLTTNPYTKVRGFMRSLSPEVFDACGRKVFVSKAICDAVFDDYEDNNPNKELKEVGGKDYGYKIPGTQGGKIIGLDGMGSSHRMYCTPKWNQLKLYDQVTEIGNFEVEKEKRSINLLMDYSVAWGFGFDEFLWHNDVS